MSFGGGSAGTTGVAAHTHNTSLTGDGGPLSTTLTDMPSGSQLNTWIMAMG